MLLHFLLLLEVLLKVFWNRIRVFLCVDVAYYGPENFLLTHHTVTEFVELRLTVADLLSLVLRFSEEMLTVLEITADFPANHHRQLVYTQLCRGSIMPPIVVVCSAN